jgi:hypothetical protein
VVLEGIYIVLKVVFCFHRLLGMILWSFVLLPKSAVFFLLLIWLIHAGVKMVFLGSFF